MKALTCVLGLILVRLSLANDHNNLEHGRPLLFDDAYSISYGERELQFGFNLNSRNSGAMTSLGYGFAKNQELSIGFDASHGMGTVGEVSYFRNISREIENSPALGLRATAMTEPGIKPRGQLRMIATKALRQYDKLHLNLDFNTDQSTRVILGYSSPLGYPKKFDQTLLSEVAIQPHETSFGIGFRRQIDARSILDYGLQTGRQVQIVAGYSVAF